MTKKETQTRSLEELRQGLAEVGKLASVTEAFLDAAILAVRVVSSDTWDRIGDTHRKDRKRWFAHGMREAALLTLYLHHFRGHVPKDVNLRDLYLGVLLHDIGKPEVVIDPAMWEKDRSSLTHADYQEILKHPEAGLAVLDRYEAASGEKISKVVRDIVRYHHEKLDGSGPYRKSGDELSFSVRVATVIDQIVSRAEYRPYHDRQFSLHGALEDIQGEDGRLYDRTIVDDFAKLFAMYPNLTIEELGQPLWGHGVDKRGE